MRRLPLSVLSACLIGAGALMSAGAATASEPAVYDWPDGAAPVLVHNASGLIFFGKDMAPLRAYAWRANTGAQHQPVYLVDLTRNGTPEVVGAGTPTFVLKANSDPIWALPKGCKQVIVGDFVADNKLDLFCLSGRNLKVYTDDGQFVWELSLGRNIDLCKAGDINGDLKVDLECKYAGSRQYAQLDSSGKVLSQSSTDTAIEDDAIELDEFGAVDKEILTGEVLFDLNGNGDAREGLLATEKSLVIQSKAEGVAPIKIDTKGDVLAAVVKDINGDKKLEILAVTSSSIFVISDGGKDVKTYSADAKRYKRYPLADLSSVYANGFEDDEKARSVVEGLQDQLSRCYAGEVSKNPYTGIGRVIVQLTVDGAGKITQASQQHSDLNDAKVEQCARTALQKGKFPNAAGDSATINVNMTYTFRDK